MNSFYRPQDFGNYFRQRIFWFGIVFLFLILLSRLFYLQVIKAGSFAEESKKNAVRDIPVIPIRGNIYDRNNKLIVDNFPFYSLTVTPKDYHREDDPLLTGILNIDTTYIDSKLKEAVDYSTYLPSLMKRNISYQQLVSIEENDFQLSGIGYRVETKRNYPAKSKLSHVLGYLTEVSKSQIKKDPDHYLLGDLTGGAGIEKFYEQELRGIKGHQFMMVNANGKITDQFDEGKFDLAPINGNDLYLTIDDELQAYGEDLLEGRSGGIVAIDPRNGEILALVSKPDYPLDQLSGLTTSTSWGKLATDPAKPLYNRATLTSYPPGSTFKMLIGLAGLQEGIITKDTKFTCNGIFYFGNRGFKCHGGRHGSIDLETAIQKSCNSYFYQLMLKLDLENMYKYARMFGFAQQPQIDLNEQRSGLIPNTAYYDRVYGPKGWTRGYLVSLGIGQGEIGISPLQGAVYASMLANRGTWYQPHLIRKTFQKQIDAIVFPKYDSLKTNISPENFDIVREGMKRVVESGTAVNARIKDIVVAGKTGTSQNSHGADHAWFISFAPYDNPTIAICVMIENAGFGGVAATPVAQKMMNFYLRGERLSFERIVNAPDKKNKLKTISKQDSLKFID